MPVAEVVCIVEGHGDRESVPILVRRIAPEVDPGLGISIPAVIRTSRTKLVKPRELERAIELAARKRVRDGGILILIDSDDDCPAQLGPQLSERARNARSDVPIGVVLAKHEFESWFLAAATSLRGRRGLPEDLNAPASPEAITGAKEWLSFRMPVHTPYSETIDQAAFTALFDLDLAETTNSFDKCRREIRRLLTDVMVD